MQYFSSSQIKGSFELAIIISTKALIFKVSMDRTPTSVPVCGTLINFLLDPDFDIERHVLANGTWEKHISQLIDAIVHQGNICLNVGANFGFHTLSLAHKIGPTGKVIAFEPNARIRARLETNCNLNPSFKERIEVYSLALGDKRDQLKLFEVPGNGNSYVAKEFSGKLGGNKNHYSEVEVTRLDDCIKVDRLDFILVDIEGMEPAFFRGADASIKKHRPIIIYETLVEHFCDSIVESEKFLIERDYIILGLSPGLGKLVPVQYPNYFSDTIAVPKEKIPQILNILADVSIFELFVGNDTKLDLVLGSVPLHNVAANLIINNEIVPMVGESIGTKIQLTSQIKELPLELMLHSHRSRNPSLNGYLINHDSNESCKVQGCLKIPATKDISSQQSVSIPAIIARNQRLRV